MDSELLIGAAVPTHVVVSKIPPSLCNQSHRHRERERYTRIADHSLCTRTPLRILE